MRKDLQKRVLVVAAALERLAGPRETTEDLTMKVHNLTRALNANKFKDQDKAKVLNHIEALKKMHGEIMNKLHSAPAAADPAAVD